VHDITVPAFNLAGDPEQFPGTGEPWTPSKLYYSAWSRARMVATHEKMLELGLESPFKEDWFDNRPDNDHLITARIELGEHADVRREALLAHATQIDPKSPFWFGLPPEVARTVHPYDDYILADSRVETEPPEDDLFAGVRDLVNR
jgi:mycothiol S-conjugate amidase